MILSFFPLHKFPLPLLALIILPNLRHKKPGEGLYDGLRKFNLPQFSLRQFPLLKVVKERS